MSDSTYTNGLAPVDTTPDHRALTNRANAQHSTGPRTQVDDLEPKGALEQQLVQSLADTSWRLTSANAPRDFSGRSRAVSRAPSPQSPSPLLSMHEHRLSRQFEKALKQLREIQAERHEKEKKQIQHAAELMQLDQDAGLPFNPTENGFVFSNDQIETYIRRRDRRREALLAEGQRRYQ